MKDIIKLQLSIFPQDQKLLAYNKGRTVCYIDEEPEKKIVTLLKKYGYKAYFYYDVVDGKVVLGRKAKDQNW